ncbi:putative RNA-directed DNA polymerase from transposon BS [Chionoecetes opilio]|uniref:Putative RNA-directed DNA polymerase from transposon BS n=1 Tax=Chionoecetes opilio TaxID=41210 RepID=A0A8J5CFZ7_CHIOP|nr:putative RNA-directed DNA polymerase from transposon BS [Chionoecetes opilio]
MTSLFIDLEGAFDSAPHDGILRKLATMHITGPTLAWLQNFLSGRTFRVAVGASTSPSQSIRRGVPQGSILSPVLFNVLLSDLHIPPHSHLLIYADDITIISRASTQIRHKHTYRKQPLHWLTG